MGKLFEIGMHNTFERLSKLPENKEIFYIIDIPELGAPARMCDMEGKKIKLFGIERVIKEPSYSKCFVSIEEFELRSMIIIIINIIKEHPYQRGCLRASMVALVHPM